MRRPARNLAARALSLVASVACAACLAEGRPRAPVTAEPDCVVDVPMRRLTPVQYAHAITDLFGGHVEPSARFPAQSGRSETGFSTEQALNTVDQLAAEQIMVAAEEVALQLPDALPRLAPCVAEAADDACIDGFIASTASRAYRRAATDEERALLRGVYDEARADEASAADAVAMVVAVMLQSPQFLYALESGIGDGEVRALTPNEIATRLSLLFWDSVPDDALLAAAREGRFDTPEGVASEAKRMLADPRAERMSRRFFREWMHVDELTEASRDPWIHPWYGSAFAESIGAAFDTYVHTALTERWTLRELLTSARAPVDGALAEHYGVEAPSTPWAWRDLDPELAIGVMTQPAFLASLAHYDESSYVGRGHFVASGLLCRTLGSPPANATQQIVEIENGLGSAPSRRDLSRAVQRRTECGSCHLTLDPPGLAFEHFDATGRWRDVDRHGNPIDASGEIASMRIRFDGPREMVEALADRYETHECFDRQMFRYFVARPERPSDACVLERMTGRGASNDSIAGGWMSLVTNPAFMHRRMDGEAP